ncbi:hypothetical protein CALCODRAFT_558456 [Calocera cornea HHB12733]|uniref:Uncharacterized protein n=1 Tax=Calocera cornea HHB12733 TaxID=1353952 RepID=A0A165CZT7_9BASI|nr:hypothetical protein CALCODRAFT_558456 [Calocera cornea HHB12733]
MSSGVNLIFLGSCLYAIHGVVVVMDFTTLGDLLGLLWGLKAMFYLAGRNAQEAIRLLMEEKEANKKNNDMRAFAHCCGQLRQAYEVQGKMEDSYQQYSETLKVYLEEIMLWDITWTTMTLGKLQMKRVCHFRLESFDKSISTVKQAMGSWETLKVYANVAKGLRLLASTYELLRRDDEYAAFMQGIECCIRHDLKKEATELLVDKWHRHMRRANMKERRPDSKEGSVS